MKRGLPQLVLALVFALFTGVVFGGGVLGSSSFDGRAPGGLVQSGSVLQRHVFSSGVFSSGVLTSGVLGKSASSCSAPNNTEQSSQADATATVLAVTSTSAVATTIQDRPFCKRCVGTGRLQCTEHSRIDCELEDATVYCSFSADCAVCGGVGWTPCPECKNEEVRAAIEKKRTSIATRKTALKWIDDKMGRPLHKAESAHFVLVFELDKIKVDKKYITAHEGLHLYVKRLEALYDDYIARMMITPKEFAEKFRVFMWYLPQDHKDGAIAFCGQNASGGVKLMGMNPSYSVCGNKQNFQDDEKLHRNIVHSVTHLLLSAQRPAFWIGNVKGGWADEGLSHWFEDRYWNICDNYCYQESNNNVDFKGGKFRLAVRKLVESEKLPSIAEVVEQNVDTLTLPMHALSFSYVDYFLSRDGAKFSELIKELKKKVPTREAVKKIYGMNLLDFEAQWKAWVLQTYPTK